MNTPPHTASEPNDLDQAEFEDFILRQFQGLCEPRRAEVKSYMRSHPGADNRDFKGKGVFTHGLDCTDDPFATAPKIDRRDLHRQVIGIPARYLPRLLRQAAAREASLGCNPLTRWYRKRAPIDPPAGKDEPC